MSDLSSQRLELTPEERQAKLERQVRKRLALSSTLSPRLSSGKDALLEGCGYHLCRNK